MDVYLIPTAGGAVKRLTIHSADETVIDWTPDGKGILFASQRGEDFMGKLYVVSIDGGLPSDAGPDMGVTGSFSPDGTKLAVNRKGRPTGASITAAPTRATSPSWTWPPRLSRT